MSVPNQVRTDRGFSATAGKLLVALCVPRCVYLHACHWLPAATGQLGAPCPFFLPRFVSYNHHLEVSEISDGTLPCQPLTFKRCGSAEFRDYLGRCVSSVDCTGACGPDGGTFISTIGMCECANAPNETAQCDGKCKAMLPTTALEGSAIRLFDPQTGEMALLEHPDIDLSYAVKYCSMLRVGKQAAFCKAHSRAGPPTALLAARLPVGPGGISCVCFCLACRIC